MDPVDSRVKVVHRLTRGNKSVLKWERVIGCLSGNPSPVDHAAVFHVPHRLFHGGCVPVEDVLVVVTEGQNPVVTVDVLTVPHLKHWFLLIAHGHLVGHNPSPVSSCNHSKDLQNLLLECPTMFYL